MRAVTAALVAVAKERGMATVLVGHVTKDGQVAGPRTLEHLVGVVVERDHDGPGAPPCSVPKKHSSFGSRPSSSAYTLVSRAASSACSGVVV